MIHCSHLLAHANAGSVSYPSDQLAAFDGRIEISNGFFHGFVNSIPAGGSPCVCLLTEYKIEDMSSRL